MDYLDFLKSKIKIAPQSGIDIDLKDVHPLLKPHQALAVQWAVKGGRRALFESFGLGKTLQQLEWMRLILAKMGGLGLIVCPLEVVDEFEEHAVELNSDYFRDGLTYLKGMESELLAPELFDVEPIEA